MIQIYNEAQFTDNPNAARIQRIYTDATLAQVQAVGWLNTSAAEGISLSPKNKYLVVYNAGANSDFFDLTALNGVYTLSVINSDTVWYDLTLTAAALASAGKVVVQSSSGLRQYKVRDLRVNFSTGLSGGGGNRLLALTDGTTAYNNAGITAALLGTAINTIWSGTGNPLPGSVAMNTSTVAGANLYLQYSGGTTDYTTGSVIISVLVQRVA